MSMDQSQIQKPQLPQPPEWTHSPQDAAAKYRLCGTASLSPSQPVTPPCGSASLSPSQPLTPSCGSAAFPSPRPRTASCESGALPSRQRTGSCESGAFPRAPLVSAPTWKKADPDVHTNHFHKGFTGRESGLVLRHDIPAVPRRRRRCESFKHCLRVHWILGCLILLALAGAVLAIILFSLPCEEIWVPVHQEYNRTFNSTVNQTVNDTINQVSNRTVNESINRTINLLDNRTYNQTINQTINLTVNTTVNRTVNHSVLLEVIETVNETVNRTVNITLNRNKTVASVADFDGMVLIDESGSITMANMFDDELDVSILIGNVLHNGTVTNGAKHFQIGALTWSGVVSPTKQFPPTSDITMFRNTIDGWRGRGAAGTTMFAFPLAQCARLVKDAAGVSSASNAFKMCLLLTDGENFDSQTCTTPACVQICNVYSISPCQVQEIAWAIKNDMNVTIPAAYTAVNVRNFNYNANNLYCYSSCNTQYPKISDCHSQVFGAGNDVQDAAIRSACKFFVEGEFSKRADLERKLVQLARTIVSQVTVMNPVTVSTVISETKQRTVPKTIQSTAQRIVQSLEEHVVQGTTQKTIQNVTQVLVQTSITQIVQWFERKTMLFLSKRVVQNFTVNYSTHDVVGVVQVGVEQDGCKDPDYFWLLLFFIPLILYLLYFPLKRRRDIWKSNLREKLRARRQALRDARDARAEQAQNIRDSIEEARAKADEKKKKLSQAKKAADAAKKAAEELAAAKAAKEEAKPDAVGKVKDSEQRLDDAAANVENSKLDVAAAEKAAEEARMKKDAEKKAKKEAKVKAKADAEAIENAQRVAQAKIDEAMAKAAASIQPQGPDPVSVSAPKAAPKKSKFRWNIAANDQYIWAMGGAGAVPKNVTWGKFGKPTVENKPRPRQSWWRKSRANNDSVGGHEGDSSATTQAKKSLAPPRMSVSPKHKKNTLTVGSAAANSRRSTRRSPRSPRLSTTFGHTASNGSRVCSVATERTTASSMGAASSYRSGRSAARRALSENERAEQQERNEYLQAMEELQALEDEIIAAREEEAVSAEAAEKAIQEIERLKQEQEDEENKYEWDMEKELHLEANGKLTEDGEFWLRCCSWCCGVKVDEECDDVLEQRKKDAEKKQMNAKLLGFD